MKKLMISVLVVLVILLVSNSYFYLNNHELSTNFRELELENGMLKKVFVIESQLSEVEADKSKSVEYYTQAMLSFDLQNYNSAIYNCEMSRDYGLSLIHI